MQHAKLTTTVHAKLQLRLSTHVLLCLPCDQHVQLLILPIVIFGVLADALLHTATTTDGNLAVGLTL